MNDKEYTTSDPRGQHNDIPIRFKDDINCEYANMIWSIMRNSPGDKCWSCELLHEEHGDVLGDLGFIRKTMRFMLDTPWLTFCGDCGEPTGSTDTVLLTFYNPLNEELGIIDEPIVRLFNSTDVIEKEPGEPIVFKIVDPVMGYDVGSVSINIEGFSRATGLRDRYCQEKSTQGGADDAV